VDNPADKRKFNPAKGKTPDYSHQDRLIDPQLIRDTCQIEPDLVDLVAAWPDLPKAIKAGILAMVQAARS
jgi:hypothetical protein